jgi:hypothetical protein
LSLILVQAEVNWHVPTLLQDVAHMKKVFTGFSVVLLCIALLGGAEKLISQQHFSWTSNTGNNAHVAVLLESEILIDGEPIQPGDEIGVFTPDALCVGGLVWDGERNRSIAVWQNNTMTPDVVDGIRVGEVMHFRLWRNSTGIEYSDVTVTYSLGDSIYTTNGMYVIESMIAGEPKTDDPTIPMTRMIRKTPQIPTIRVNLAIRLYRSQYFRLMNRPKSASTRHSSGRGQGSRRFTISNWRIMMSS